MSIPFDTRKYCLENKIVSFSFKLYWDNNEQKKKFSGPSWNKNKINKDNYYDFVSNKNGFGIFMAANQLIVLDCDIDKAEGNFPLEILNALDASCSAIVKTPGGKHYYFKTDKLLDRKVGTFWNGQPIKNFDLIAGDCYINAPPSNYTKGDKICSYNWIKGDLSTITELPEDIYLAIQKPERESLSDIELILKSLSITRWDNFDSWLRIGFVLFNEGYSVELWDKYSQLSKSYTPRGCYEKWKYFVKKDRGLTKASLYFWLKQDNPDVYQQLLHNLEDMFVVATRGTHQITSEIFYNMKSNDYIYSNELHWLERKPNNTYKIYSQQNKKVYPDKLNLVICDTLGPFFQEAVSYFSYLAKRASEDTEKINAAKRVKEIMRTQDAIQSTPYFNNMTNFLESYYLDPEIVNKIDSNPNLLAFEDKVFDFTTCKFRDILASDFIATTTGYNAPDIETPVMPQLQQFLDSLFEDPEVLDYVLQLLAYSLWGDNRFQLVVFFKGAGGNGKGRLNNLMERCLGCYAKTLPSNYVISKTEGKGGALNELANCKSVRYVYVNEPESTDKIQVGFIKLISGQDKLSVRKLYSAEFEYLPQFTFFLSLNHTRLSKSEIAVQRRLRVIEFPFEFKTSDFLIPTNPYHRLANYELETVLKTDEIRDSFTALLLRTFRDKIKDAKELVTPRKVKEATLEYLQDSNPIAKWLEEHIDTNADASWRMTATDVLNLYNLENHSNFTNRQIGGLLSNLGYRVTKSNGKESYHGFKKKELQNIPE